MSGIPIAFIYLNYELSSALATKQLKAKYNHRQLNNLSHSDSNHDYRLRNN